MDKLFRNVTKELDNIADVGINAGNLDHACKLVDIAKNIKETEFYKEGIDGMRGYDMIDDYRRYDRHDPWEEESYGRRGIPGSGRRRDGRGRFMGEGEGRYNEHLNRIMDGLEQYNYGKTRYRDGGDSDRMEEGLDKVMYAVCTFVENMMDFADSPQEKEIIRKHISKMKNI